MERSAVTDHMEVAVSKVDDFVPVRIRDVSFSNIPFLRNDPIEHACAARHLMNSERNTVLKDLERFAHTVSRNAAANRVQLLDQCLYFVLRDFHWVKQSPDSWNHEQKSFDPRLANLS